MARAKSEQTKHAILQAWADAQANGETRTGFHERIKGTELDITYGGLQRWLNAGEEGAVPTSSKSLRTYSVGLSEQTQQTVQQDTRSSIRKQFDEMYDADREAAYVRYLNEQQDDIKDRILKKAQEEINAELEKLSQRNDGGVESDGYQSVG